MPTKAAAFRVAFAAAAFGASTWLAGCSPLSLAVTAAGIATDTSVAWEVAKHLHGKLTENDATPCLQLGSVQRALNPRCEYRPGRILKTDLARSGLQECPLATAARDPRLWRALPELLEVGATPDRCTRSPLAGLAAAHACPDFAAAPKPVLDAIRTLAENDPAAVRHDVFRMLGCPTARAAGLHRTLEVWLDRGDLEPAKLSFSPLGAAHPDLLVSRFGRELEIAGHQPQTALDVYDGVLAPGFEEALRTSNWQALDWWLSRLPRLANAVPPSRGGQLAWLPLQRVLVSGFLADPATQHDMVAFLLARGANPSGRLPFEPSKTVLTWAREVKSPLVALLDAPRAKKDPPIRQAATRYD